MACIKLIKKVSKMAMKQLLYVEDSTTSQMLMRKYVSDAGELTIVPNLRAASEILGRQNFDLIISDFVFPEGDAIVLIEDIRRRAPALQLPVLVVSGSMDATLLSRVIKAGANDGMPKPIHVEAFRAMLNRLLTEPYVREQDTQLCSVNCLQWEVGGTFFEFCPELELKLSGPSREEVAQAMAVALQAKLSAGTPLGYTRRERVVTHVIKVESPAIAADARTTVPA